MPRGRWYRCSDNVLESNLALGGIRVKRVLYLFVTFARSERKGRTSLKWQIGGSPRYLPNPNFVCAPFGPRDWEIAVTITPMKMALHARDWEIAVTITPMKMALQPTIKRCDAIYNHLSFWHDLLPSQKVKMFIWMSIESAFVMFSSPQNIREPHLYKNCIASYVIK